MPSAADQGQPITIGSIARTGLHVTINSPLGGTLTIGQDFRAGRASSCFSGPNVNAKLGDNVRYRLRRGRRADFARLELDGRRRSLSRQLHIPRQHGIPPKAIYINNKFQGYVQW